MLRVGLTGGIGSGKSTVAAILAAHGAVVVDSDAIAREVVAPGTEGLARVLSRFGPDVTTADGSLDRAALAAIVFGDPRALADLNSVLHPLVAARTRELLAAADEAAVVVFDVPLLVENAMQDRYDRVVVVHAETETRLSRLAARGVAKDDALRRMAAQASDEQRAAVADELIDNSGGRERLEAEVASLWRRLAAAHDCG
jgi:dephospho-CoA kinase